MKPLKTATKRAGRSTHSTQLLRKAAHRSNRPAPNDHPERGKPAERRTRTHSTARAQRTLKALASPPRNVRFPQAKGRVVEEVEFFIDPSYNGLTIRFQDKTSLSFEFATGFAVEAYLSRWKTGNERVLRYWPRIHSEPAF